MEPLSVLSVISFTISIVEFFAKDVPALISKGQDMSNYRKLYESYFSRLADCLESLRNWEKFWLGLPAVRSNETLQEFWGRDGRKIVELKMKRFIRNSRYMRVAVDANSQVAAQAGVHVAVEEGGKHNSEATEDGFLTDEEIDRWLGFGSKSGPRGYTAEDIGVLQRINFGLLQNEKLHRSIKMLEEEIFGLWRFSRLRFATMGHVRPGEEPSQERIDLLAKLMHSLPAGLRRRDKNETTIKTPDYQATRKTTERPRKIIASTGSARLHPARYIH